MQAAYARRYTSKLLYWRQQKDMTDHDLDVALYHISLLKPQKWTRRRASQVKSLFIVSESHGSQRNSITWNRARALVTLHLLHCHSKDISAAQPRVSLKANCHIWKPMFTLQKLTVNLLLSLLDRLVSQASHLPRTSGITTLFVKYLISSNSKLKLY